MRHTQTASVLTYNSIASHVLLWINESIAFPAAYFLRSFLYVLSFALHQLVIGILYIWAIIWMLSVRMTVRLSVFVISKLSSVQDPSKESTFTLPLNSQLLNQVVKVFQCLQWNINPAQLSKFFANPQLLQNAGNIFKNAFKMVFKVQF